ncbi:hypothetical protein ACJMK2_042949 [Sinanodonta woodiana]|uniref:Uncharacterized protein n=1 Tax=Sinanodonta woodiana TaxID=1069815 RepID=A0ABD3VVE9_SINWO
MIFVLTVLCLITASIKADSAINRTNTRRSKSSTDEQRLYRYLMKNYDRNTRPVYNASQAVNVSVGISLTQIFDVDERNQVITTNIWLDQEWMDEKLIWDPQEYSGLSVLRIPCMSIWRPDIVLYNSADDYKDGYMEALAMVSNNGHVFWPPIVKLRSTCSIDITYFPFDDQICKLKLGSWAYDGTQVDVFKRAQPVDLSNFVGNGEWELINVRAVRNVVYYPCCTTPFPDVTFTIHIRRRTLYYTYNVIVPCIMLSILTLAGFWMRPDSGEKVSLGLTVLLAFSVFMLLIAENMPATSSFVPLIGIYLTTTMSLTSLSVILAVTTSNINHRGLKEQHIPNWIKKLLLCLAKVFCMRLHFIKTDRDLVKPDKCMKQMDSNDSGYSLMGYENGELVHPVLNSLKRQDGVDRSDCMEEVLQKLQTLISREDEKDKNELIIKQWTEAAEVLDRLLFWLFVLSTTFGSIIILVILPLFKSVHLEET